MFCSVTEQMGEAAGQDPGEYPAHGSVRVPEERHLVPEGGPRQGAGRHRAGGGAGAGGRRGVGDQVADIQSKCHNAECHNTNLYLPL